ncbi:MAG: ADP-ribosylglycohydrolase family protein [Planctomycetota bacterium]|jgi:ADP-ribosylglycohydrolase
MSTRQREISARARDALLGPFVADAASAGLHWIYDTDEVRRRGGDTPEFQPPGGNTYHAQRSLGQLTHYGDHALVMLESLVARGGLDTEDYRRGFVERFGAAAYDGYRDHATNDLLTSGRGADDNEAGCFTKLAALVVRFLNDPELEPRLEAAVRVTHNNTQAVRYSLAAATAVRTAILGASPQAAVAAVAERRGGATAAAARKALEANSDVVAFAVETGQNCPVPNAFPVALQAVLHGPDFKAVVRNSILSGGDSSGRLFVAAAIRGAADGVPADWLKKLADRARIEELTDRLLEQSGLA